MRHLFLTALCVLTLVGNALADGRAFPPDNCSEQTPFMAFTAIEGSNTYCQSGQDILHNAIPTCTPGQVVGYDGAAFYCKEDEETTPLPNCSSGQVLTSINGALTCVQDDDDDGSTPVIDNPKGFYAYATTSQSIPQSTWTKIIFNGERFDTGSNFADSRFTPSVAGHYILAATVNTEASQQSRILQAMIYKNGAVYAMGSSVPVYGTDPSYSTVTAVAEANGTTDYFEVYVRAGYSSQTIAAPERLYFTGALLK